MKKNKFLFYLKKLKWIFFFVTLVMALVGSYQYHSGQYSNKIKELTVVLYSTMKLFTFSPTSFVTNEAPLLYELAIWMAPAVTMVGFFSLFKKIYSTIKFNIFHLGKEHLVILGDNDSSLEFIKNINREKDKIALILFCDFADTIDEEKYKSLLTKVVRLDFSNPENEINSLTIKDENLGSVVRIISFEEEPRNYGLINNLYKMHDWSRHVEVYVETSNYRVKELIEAKLDKLEKFDIHYFNTEDLLVKNLLENSTFVFNNPLSLSESWELKSFASMEEISGEFGNYNLLIVGFSDISKSFLNHVSNLMTINPMSNFSVTIVDTAPYSKFNDFKHSRAMIDRVMNYELVNVGLEDYKIRNEVAMRHSQKEYSGALFAFDDVIENILQVDKLIDVLKDVPIAVYSDKMVEMDTVIESLQLRHNKITAFGDKSSILTKSVIIEEELLKKAKFFNVFYNKTMNKLMGWYDDDRSAEEQWMGLSNIKKESSAFQAAHRNTKLRILNRFAQIKELPDSAKDIVASWEEKLEGKTIEEQIKIIEKDPYLNFLTALEHKRWNNFYYMRDFVFSDVKDEYKKTHDCLIDDWDEFLAGKQRDKAIFDTLSSLSLFVDSGESK